MALTPKQAAFCEEYIKDLNATQAAIRAGYSADTAKEQASRLLTNVNVAETIARLKAERSAETKIDAAWLLTRLAEEATADVADIYDDYGALKPVKDWPKIWRQGLVAGLDVEELSVDGVTVGVIKKIKVSDRVKRLELIGKHIGVQAFQENVNHTGLDALAERLERAGRGKTEPDRQPERKPERGPRAR